MAVDIQRSVLSLLKQWVEEKGKKGSRETRRRGKEKREEEGFCACIRNFRRAKKIGGWGGFGDVLAKRLDERRGVAGATSSLLKDHP